MTELVKMEIVEGADLGERLNGLTEYIGGRLFPYWCHKRFLRTLWGQFTEMRRREIDRFGSPLTPLRPSTLEGREMKDRPYSGQFPILDRLWNPWTHLGVGAVAVADEKKAMVGATGRMAEIMGYHQTGTKRMAARDVIGVLDEALPAFGQDVVNEIVSAAGSFGFTVQADTGGESALKSLQGALGG